MDQHDVIIVGAGLSGIGAAYYLQQRCPGKRYAILEARDAIGGTWDLFRYPGIRSDSDMHTLGYDFKPWREAKAIADGPSIRRYVSETADEHGIREHIRFGLKVTGAEWSSTDAAWTVTAERTGTRERVQMRCNFLYMCGGYYNYNEPFDPGFQGVDQFRGTVVHPQFWPEDLDYAGKRVLVIGSGATAMTLVPAMAQQGARVTMLQRSPTYVASRPDQDRIANALRRVLPEKWAYAITRFKNVRMQNWIYRQTRTNPEKVKQRLLDMVRKAIGNEYTAEHFTPHYNPWDQRLCLIPNDDLYNAINDGSAKVVTAEIDRFVDSGVLLTSGEVLDADIIVTATGLKLSVLSDVTFRVDGKDVHWPETVSYQGMMFTGVPNLVQTFGYINASWTLRADITAQYVCRLLKHMDHLGMRQATPRLRDEDHDMSLRPWIDDFSAGYMQRVMHLFPKQGDRDPWRNTQNYLLDKKLIPNATFDDGALVFGNPALNAVAETPAEPSRRADAA
ncbi:MAG TPA: NAD(P)/FAD-dependent oxidoreductase [Pseudomonadales bacterium]